MVFVTDTVTVIVIIAVHMQAGTVTLNNYLLGTRSNYFGFINKIIYTH